MIALPCAAHPAAPPDHPHCRSSSFHAPSSFVDRQLDRADDASRRVHER
jgi:hypothetical protein